MRITQKNFVCDEMTTPIKLRKVIFLDMDGVLLPFPPPPSLSQSDSTQQKNPLFPSSTLEPLKRLWELTSSVTHDNNSAGIQYAAAEVEWVLSSTWRVQKRYIQDIEEALQAFGIPIVFSDITDPTLHSERQWEIYDWLERNELVASSTSRRSYLVWLALDDEDLLHGDANIKHQQFFEGHVVQTTSNIGLTMQDVDRGMQLWETQLKSLIQSPNNTTY